jgi:hypothetical protein
MHDPKKNKAKTASTASQTSPTEESTAAPDGSSDKKITITGKVVGPDEGAISPPPRIRVEADGSPLLPLTWNGDGDTFSFCVCSGAKVSVYYPTNAGASCELIRKSVGLVEFQACDPCSLPEVTYESAPGLISGLVEREVLRGSEVCWAPLPGVQVEVFDIDRKPLVSPPPTDFEGYFQFPNPGKKGLILCLPPEIPSSGGLLVLKDHEISVLLDCTQSYELCPIHYCLARSEVVAQVTDGTKGVVGVPVTLTYCGGACLPAQQTDEYGNCSFPGLLPAQVAVSIPTSFRDSCNKSWELPVGQPNPQLVSLVGGVSQNVSFVYQEEEHRIHFTVLSDGTPAPGILVEVRSSDGDRVIDRRQTDQSGTVDFCVSHGGEYEIRVYDDERVTAPPLRKHVLVQSTVQGTFDIATQAS